MRGDRPYRAALQLSQVVFTPHARGSTPSLSALQRIRSVYPACAGIDRPLWETGQASLCLPRMRGDRPEFLFLSQDFRMFTPHARGSTFPLIVVFNPFVVYPACAGIDPAGH